MPITTLIQELMQEPAINFKALARAITLVENELAGYEELLESLIIKKTQVIGITGPPGAGKSTITDCLIGELIRNEKKAAVLCVDPSSPFNKGAFLGDRVRMSRWFNNPNVFIRSFATRGYLGGLTTKIFEITDLVKAMSFDYIIIETVGVGQSEVEIAGLADTTMVVLVPEAGDEIQTMKSGLMEIADIFVVNKCDRPDAELFIKNLGHLLVPAIKDAGKTIPLIKTIASQNIGIDEMAKEIVRQQLLQNNHEKTWLLVEKAYRLIGQRRMRMIDKNLLGKRLEHEMQKKDFNIYKLVKEYE
jgi:LAO/AO transport system kinase